MKFGERSKYQGWFEQREKMWWNKGKMEPSFQPPTPKMSLQSIVKPASLTGSLFRCSAIGVSARSLSTKVIAPSSYTTSISRCSTLLPQSTSTSLSSQSRSFSRSIPSLSKDTTWLNKGENVSYSELKPETEAPSGVSSPIFHHFRLFSMLHLFFI